MSLGTRKTKTEGSGNVLRRRRTILAWGFALPFVVVFCVFMLIPLLSSMAMSFTDITSKDLRTPFNVNFVGLDQYIALFHDRRFLHALGVTGIFVLVGLPITMVIALAFAVASTRDPSTSTRSSGRCSTRRSSPVWSQSPSCGGTSSRRTACSTRSWPSSALPDRTGCTTPATHCPR